MESRKPFCQRGEKAKALRRVARKLKNRRGRQRQGCLMGCCRLNDGASFADDPGQQERADFHAVHEGLRSQISGVEFHLAMPVKSCITQLRDIDAATPQAVRILLKYLENGMSHNGRALFDDDIVVADAFETVQKTGQRGSRLS
jgi:hypothetical protein